jgi:hypothetical protein
MDAATQQDGSTLTTARNRCARAHANPSGREADGDALEHYGLLKRRERLRPFFGKADNPA